MAIAKHNVTNRFEAVRCHACGRSVARKSREQRYCSDRCRQFAFRENKARTAIKISDLGEETGRVTTPQKTVNENNGLQTPKSGSSVPLNILGGYRWPNATGIDRELLRKIIRAEIGGVRAP
jgi:endogenous inhibitor of DNA gyrase (YacG/DUF329 family)